MIVIMAMTKSEVRMTDTIDPKVEICLKVRREILAIQPIQALPQPAQAAVFPACIAALDAIEKTGWLSFKPSQQKRGRHT
jgi:hypothetical protein